ncbi:MAG: 3-methyl-2-oxobutanoate hydroxymethyltransferase [Candidatus Cloacimonadaceae bacterium]|nr:3-methyl-2-oxobutanoate hydroxymethyltransferase [Candidatus Cloacimonadaceae bacterium]MDP3113763.1 3-methyl-2-oxobutanoate hydroxymethyltransferase [Candidatus Cloacimonadaceae bacterium]
MTKEKLLNVASFKTMKANGKKITMITAYDFSMARCAMQSDMDIILVGDSLGMVVLGYETTLDVTIDDISYHSAAVRRGAEGAFIIADMPYMSYHLSIEDTKQNAAELIIRGGANAVKLEGGSASRLDAIRGIVDCEIPVCAHIGLTPQSIHRLGGYKVQGKTEAEYEDLLHQASAIEAAGAFMLVLEGIPEALGQEISSNLTIPTIGIGAGRYCDGQVLVYHDILGLSGMHPKFVKQYADISERIVEAIKSYGHDVRSGVFPAAEHVYYPINKA